MTKFYKTSEFKNLEKEWYQKLAKDGFEDAENAAVNWNGDRPLKAWHSFRSVEPLHTQKQALYDYYDRAKEILDTYEFKSNMHRWIWELHCKGYSKRRIEKVINGPTSRQSHHLSIKREQIGKIIAEIAKEVS